VVGKMPSFSLLALALLCAAATGLRLPAGISRRAAVGAGVGGAASLLAPAAFAADSSPALLAQRFSISGNISPLPPLGQYSRYEDQLSTPKGSKAAS